MATHGKYRNAGRYFGRVATIAAFAAVAACAQNAESLAPASPNDPWRPTDPKQSALFRSQQSASVSGSHDFSVQGDPEVARLPPAPPTVAGKVYKLPELIDLAARNNPVTQAAWEQARRSALAVGIAEATFLPTLSANVVAGVQDTTTPIEILGQERDIDSTADGALASLGVQWLLFDFGQRKAAVDAARQVSVAANVAFNGTHQQLIYDVTRTYYQYGAARRGAELAGQALNNSRAILAATEQREKGGIGTTVEVALARQQVAQSELRKVVSQGLERDSYQALLGAMGVSPMLKLKVAGSGTQPLSHSSYAMTDEIIRSSLLRRPDVLASFAAIKASEAGVRVAKADFLPKVFLGASVGTEGDSFDIDGLPTIGQQASGTGVLVGATMPIYDGGLRAANVKLAESRVSEARAAFGKTQETAVREMVVASNALRSALESYQASNKLTEAASITYDAALDAYRNGLGTVTAATQADTDLLDARQARADAHAASLIAAANLAFMLGSMSSR